MRKRRLSDDSDADPVDPHCARDSLQSEGSDVGEECPSTSSSPVDEYDMNTYFAQELRIEALRLSAFLARLRDARFAECGQAFAGFPARQDDYVTALLQHAALKPRRRRRRATPKRSMKGSHQGTVEPWSISMPRNLGRRRIVAPPPAPDSRQDVSSGEADFAAVGHSCGHSSDASDASDDHEPTSSEGIARLSEDGENDLWDEDLCATEASTGRDSVGLRWEDVPDEETEHDDSSPPSLEHRTLRGGADEDFDSVFDCDF